MKICTWQNQDLTQVEVAVQNIYTNNVDKLLTEVQLKEEMEKLADQCFLELHKLLFRDSTQLKDLH